MSKQSAARQAQGYFEAPKQCGNCRHFTSKKETVRDTWGPWEKESFKRCAIGGFAVKKTAVCALFERP